MASPNLKKFPPYYVAELVEKGLKDGTLLKGKQEIQKKDLIKIYSWNLIGVIRINPKRYEDAFIANPNPAFPDILIKGMRNRNRALHTDEVRFLNI